MTKVSRRVGLELELLAPSGLTRFAFAESFAERIGGSLEFRLHYHGDGVLPSGRPNCILSRSVRVLDSAGKWLVDAVDDITIAMPPSKETSWTARTDDVRLALLAEAVSGSPSSNYREVLRHFSKRLNGQWTDNGVLADSFGHPLALVQGADAVRERVCEVVTRPLRPDERDAVVTAILQTAKALKFKIPKAAAMHAHFDAAPLKTTARLQALITRFTQHRSSLWKMLKPNKHCQKLGPFPDMVVRVAREADAANLPFSAFAAALSLAGADKYCDLNILGVIERFPRHPTVEFRCLPVDFSVEATLDRLDTAEAFILEAASL